MLYVEELTPEEWGDIAAKKAKQKADSIIFNQQMRKVMKVIKDMLLSDNSDVKTGIASGPDPPVIATSGAMLELFRGRPAEVSEHAMGDPRVLPYSIMYPPPCVLLPWDCEPNRFITSEVTYIKHNAYAYADTDKLVAGGSLDINLADELGRTIMVKDLAEPILISIKVERPSGALPLYPPKELDPRVYMRYHDVQVGKANISVHAVFRPVNDDLEFVLFWQYDEKPGATPKFHEAKYPVSRAPFNTTRKRVHWWMSSEEMSNRQGKYWMGVAEIATRNTSADCRVPVGEYVFNRCPTATYGLLMLTKGCYYFDRKVETWTSGGCVPRKTESLEWTQCACDHLTPFGVGLAVAPNSIDFDYVFANASFANNLSIYCSIILVYVLFAAFLVYARIMDGRDVKKLGSIPLADNDPSHSFVYEVIFSTGFSKGSATDSQVSFVMAGERAETNVRTISPALISKRRPFRNGGVDSFVLTTKFPLGPLQYLRVWHDNSGRGSFKSWYLSRVVVLDCQTGQKYPFLVERWLAVDEEDGLIERMVPTAGKAELTETNTLMGERAKQQLTDGHLWFSVFARPVHSRFTRTQRVCCCMSLLMTSMLASAMWYGTVPDSAGGSQGLKMGPFSLSFSEIGIGLMGSLVVFPINLLIVHLFRKARRRDARPSRVAQALKDSRHPLVVTEVPRAPKQRNCLARLIGPLPWWFRQVAWCLVLVSIAVSTIFVLFYGIQFGDEKARKWLTSMLVSLFSSILVTQPLKLLVVAVLFSLLCKRFAGDADTDAEEDERMMALRDDEDYLTGDETAEVKTLIKPESAEQAAARQDRLKEKQMWVIARELVVYLIFAWVVLIMAHGSRDSLSYEYTKQNRLTFVGDVAGDEFRAVRTPAQIYEWLEHRLLPGLRHYPTPSSGLAMKIGA